MIEIATAEFPQQLETVRAIFREYAGSLDIDLGFQNFESELAGLPGKFAAPSGRVLLAYNREELIGCVAMRPLDDTTCEMKRLYVRPSGRGLRAGRQLATRICDIARDAGYHRICLDSLPTMQAALDLYASLGFARIPAYVFNPIAGAVFLERNLVRPENQSS
ncbi:MULTISPECIES: GNAT family N-acetyltransferase [unclassified Paraburkholderia]|uniref:GNAT family N-acetyltransferase n=1 Tax=unclassified Paraburkholderia TaxID=2615204 RepID=UPI000E22CDA0|nr:MULTISPECIES: GNAT family N-acetyltransferase [unclassified Paraburkholderia]REE23993.1 ribosomal protein S18 acetylase RimI-like enzyme [Paraburkholderia sp. BL27I4N3]RKR38113.1 ribosomal protein S18 acetylase RimI-like enzyme [Paraburkholderia sp. BL17N1]